ncbi:MAG: hypothetical protein IPK19_16200 [Chloroflexi bacterium]|nr:hypothetical protein [Chloroflexota bacterium]
MNHRLLQLLSVVLLLLVAATACAPVQNPPELLINTPGPGVTVTSEEVITPIFVVDYPADWRVLTSPADQPVSVTLVAPGDCELIVVSSVNLTAQPFSPSCNQKDMKVETTVVTFEDGGQVVVVGVARESEYEGFLQVWERIVASVEDVSLRDIPDTAPSGS